MTARNISARVLIGLGALAMLVGAADPLEGSVVILPGSALVALGVFLAQAPRQVMQFWLAVFFMILLGISGMFVVSSFGGIGGTSGRSMWWGVFILPYPIGWLMALFGGIITLVRRFKPKRQTAAA